MVYAINSTCYKKEVHSYNVTSWVMCYHNKGKVDNISPFELGGTEGKTSANSIKVSCLESSVVELAEGGGACCEAAVLWSRGCGKQMSIWIEGGREGGSTSFCAFYIAKNHHIQYQCLVMIPSPTTNSHMQDTLLPILCLPNLKDSPEFMVNFIQQNAPI